MRRQKIEGERRFMGRARAAAAHVMADGGVRVERREGLCAPGLIEPRRHHWQIHTLAHQQLPSQSRQQSLLRVVSPLKHVSPAAENEVFSVQGGIQWCWCWGATGSGIMESWQPRGIPQARLCYRSPAGNPKRS